MPEQIVSAIVEGGKATPGPPIGPALGPLKVNTKAIVDEINAKTKALDGVQVPVKIIVDTAKKTWKIEVGSPPAAALIRKELRLEKGGKEPGHLRVGDLSEEQTWKIAEAKFGGHEQGYYNQIVGTARAMGVSVGQGAVTAEEVAKYEAEVKAKEEAAAVAAAAKAAAQAAAPAAGAAPGAAAAPAAAPAAVAAAPAAKAAAKPEAKKK